MGPTGASELGRLVLASSAVTVQVHARAMADAPQSPRPAALAADAAAAPADTPGTDVVLVHGRTDDQAGLRVLRAREGRVELGEVRPLQHGKPIHGELVQLTPRADSPLLCDVSPVLDQPQPSSSRHGPAQIATRSYRDSWERIFGGATPTDEALSEPDRGDPRSLN